MRERAPCCVVTQMLSSSVQYFTETDVQVCSTDTLVNPRTNNSGGHGSEGDLSYLPVSHTFIHVILRYIVFDGSCLHHRQILWDINKQQCVYEGLVH